MASQGPVYERWVDAWSHAVAGDEDISGLLDLSTHRFIALSARAAALMGGTPGTGLSLDYLAAATTPREAAGTIQMARDGLVQGLQSRRPFTTPDGIRLDVCSWNWVIAWRGEPDLGVWVGREAGDLREPGGQLTAKLIDASTTGGQIVATCQLDQGWRIANVDKAEPAAPASDRLWPDPARMAGAYALDLVDGESRGALLIAMARSTGGHQAAARVRFLGKEVTVVATVSDGSEEPTFAFSISSSDLEESGGVDGQRQRLERLEEHVRRIHAEVHAARLVGAPESDGDGVPALEGLSPRQVEVVSRLIQGERVPTIARAMYLSQSTVRNHLVAIFRRLGVHSQEELIHAVRRRRDTPSGTP